MTTIYGNVLEVTPSTFRLSSTTKGFRVPVMTETQKLAIESPEDGLIVYDTTNTSLSIYYSLAWHSIPAV